MSCSVSSYLDGLALQLKDCTPTVNGKKKHIRWTEEHLLWITRIAAKQIQRDRSDLFKTDKRIKLNIGCYTTVCDQGCEEISTPIYLEGKDCEEIDVSSSDDSWVNKYFESVSCGHSKDGEYKIDSITINPEDPCKIKIDPPVPDDGVQRYIIARCLLDTDDSLDSGVLPTGVCKNLHAFTQLVLAYCYGMDGMINVDSGQWQVYHENYRQLINDSFRHDLSARDPRVIFNQIQDNLERG